MTPPNWNNVVPLTLAAAPSHEIWVQIDTDSSGHALYYYETVTDGINVDITDPGLPWFLCFELTWTSTEGNGGGLSMLADGVIWNEQWDVSDAKNGQGTLQPGDPVRPPGWALELTAAGGSVPPGTGSVGIGVFRRLYYFGVPSLLGPRQAVVGSGGTSVNLNDIAHGWMEDPRGKWGFTTEVFQVWNDPSTPPSEPCPPRPVWPYIDPYINASVGPSGVLRGARK